MARLTQMTCHICNGTYIDKRVNKFKREALLVELDGRPLTVYVNVLGG